YWYNGHIYSSEIARGLDIFELTPTSFLTQNEIDAAKAVRVSQLNVQTQERIEWPKTLVTAKAYLDQLERSQALSAIEIADLRLSIQKAGSSAKELKSLKKYAKSLDKSAAVSNNPFDAARMRALAEILKNPAV
ncbi:MAG: hypothetical protein ACT4O9_01870, partial [Blastocatellia bacterium]